MELITREAFETRFEETMRTKAPRLHKIITWLILHKFPRLTTWLLKAVKHDFTSVSRPAEGLTEFRIYLYGKEIDCFALTDKELARDYKPEPLP